MRILQVGKYYYPEKGGIETNLRCLSVGLQESELIEVVVATRGNQSRVDQLDGLRIERLAAPVNLFGAPISPGLISRLQQAEADVVHVHLPNPWAAIAYLLSGCRIPMVVTYHSDIVRQSYIEPVFRPILSTFLKRAQTIICATQGVIDNSETLVSFRDRCAVIPYGIDLAEIERAEPVKVKSIRQVYSSGPIILAVGRLVSYKGFEYLIRAMVNIDASLVIVGNGPLKQQLLQLAHSLGVLEKVTILEGVEDIGPYYHAADVFVLPSVSRNEAFGIVQIEAMAAGKPVINTQLASGVPWVSLHGLTGLTVQPADSVALSEAINLLLGDQDLRVAYGKAARARAFSEFSLKTMLSRTTEIYSRVATQQSQVSVEQLSGQAAAGD